MFLIRYFVLVVLLLSNKTQAQTFFKKNFLTDVTYQLETQATFSTYKTPSLLVDNHWGMRSYQKNNAYIRFKIQKEQGNDSLKKWHLGYGVDFSFLYHYPSTFFLQQLYTDLSYKKINLLIGCKEINANLKHNLLSSGGQTLGINAHPIPQLSLSLPSYLYLDKKQRIGIKGHLAFGLFNDKNWKKNYVGHSNRYTGNVLFHSKSAFIKLGNFKSIPLELEAGLEMAVQFGGTAYNQNSYENGQLIKDVKADDSFWNALVAGGSDPSDGIYKNVAGNTLGNWLFSLKYNAKEWNIRAYYDHFFEDHSMLFLQYNWYDGLKGLEINFPKNPFLSTFVYEYITSEHQAGPLYHDHTQAIPDQISARDNYYNHSFYDSWTYYGMPIGNPIFSSPLYLDYSKIPYPLYIASNRFKAHHLGLLGEITPSLSYRILYTLAKHKGTYELPYDDILNQQRALFEITYIPLSKKTAKYKDWKFITAFSFDKDPRIKNTLGIYFSIIKKGLLIK